MTNWKRITVKISEEEFNELEKIKKRYKISYNKIIRSGLQFYVGLSIAKEELFNTGFLKVIKPLTKDIKRYTKSPRFSRKVNTAVSRLGEQEIAKLNSRSKNFEKRIQVFKRRRKRGRPKVK